MNTLRKPLIRERNYSETAPALAVEYDDGNPATLVPMSRTPEAASIRRDRIGPDREADEAAGWRSGLAEVARESAVEYDDGNPATILG